VSFDLRIPVSQKVLRVVSRMDRLRGEWAAGPNVSRERLERLAEASRIQSIAASCRMSGIRVSDTEVAGVLRGESVPLDHARAVLGYAAALDDGLGGGGLLTPPVLARLNAAVLGADPTETAEPLWRDEAAHREAFDDHGQATGVVIQLLPPRLIGETLEGLLSWFELETRERGAHPVPVIAAFTLALMAIGPFRRGNGRTIRVLNVHLLRRLYDYMPYASLEGQIEDRRTEYWEAFYRAQDGIWSGHSDLSPWLDWFAGVLDAHRERVEAKTALERTAHPLSPLQEAVLHAVREHGSVDAALLLRATGANRNTLKDNLRRMVDCGWLERTGDRRTSRYRLPSDHRAKSESGQPVRDLV
jgi:Fic family protein